MTGKNTGKSQSEELNDADLDQVAGGYLEIEEIPRGKSRGVEGFTKKESLNFEEIKVTFKDKNKGSLGDQGKKGWNIEQEPY